MNYQGKKTVGIWIDHQEAFIISTADRMNNGNYEVVKHIKSMHTNHSSSEDAFHHKQEMEIKRMYAVVATYLMTDDAIFITGPGKAQEEFYNFLRKDRHFQEKEISIGASDHPTEPQRIAQVRKHFTVEG